MVEIEPASPFQSLLDYFQWDEVNDVVPNVPNEIFNDLANSSISSFRHRAFAYSFYYLISYLYRNKKYGVIELSDLYSLRLIELLYGDRKPINYITKRGGVLDQMGYTSSENDFPISCIIDSTLTGFNLYSELNEVEKDMFSVPSGFMCKKPLKAFYRHKDDDYCTGTFFEFENTHRIDFTIFARCISSSRYGFEQFYIYSFLSAYEQFINSKPNVFKSYIALSISISPKNLNRILSNLEKLKLVKFDYTNGFSYITRKKMSIKK